MFPFGMKGKGSGKQSPLTHKKKRQKWKRQIGPHRYKRKRTRTTAMLEIGRHGHMSKDCKNMATLYDETQEEEFEYI